MAGQLTVDMERYRDVVAQQRNNALDQVAQLTVAVEDLMAERDQLREENERLRGQAPDQPPT